MSSKGPNLKAYLDRTISLTLNKKRKVVGTLRGFDQFMNIVLEDAEDESPNKADGGKSELGTIVVRGSNILQFELIR